MLSPDLQTYQFGLDSSQSLSEKLFPETHPTRKVNFHKPYMYLVILGRTWFFVTSSSAPQVWAVMSACICRQSGSLTLGNVKCTMNVNRVWTKCSGVLSTAPQDKHGCDKHSSRSQTVTPESLRTGKLIYNLPSFQGLFSREKPAATAESCASSLLLLQLYKSEKGPPCPCHASLEQGHGMAVHSKDAILFLKFTSFWQLR